jgi:antirestriction protein ArdC
MNDYTDLCTEVTARLLAAIEHGPGGWVMPWHTTPSLFDVRNAATDNRYRGANTIALAVSALERNFPTGWWATYRQWSEIGGQIRRGETASRITKWVAPRTTTPDTITDDDGTVLHALGGRRLVPKVYAVFNAEQVDGWVAPGDTPTAEHDRDEYADAWIAATGAEIRHGHGHACYRPATDVIEVPDLGRFCDPAAYFSTVCHELVHWTGHPTRINRDLTGRFGDDAYAAEELIAELGAAFACALLAITPSPRDDHAAYLAHWLRILRADPKALFTVAARAQAAVDHLNHRIDEPQS